ncbi:MAG TPA: hypothetical protein VMS75_07860 [Terriglobales bacterium]|nr:hypothetical protein [Terriglobales bacterium]
MRPPEPRPASRTRGAWTGVGLVLAAAGLAAAGAVARAGPRGQAAGGAAGPVSAGERKAQYSISAHLFIVGNLGEAGSMTIESAARPKDGRLEKTLRMAGETNDAQKKKNRDYRGDFSLLKVYPLRADGMVDEEAAAAWRGTESTSSGFLKLNKKYQAEKIAFFPDHAVSTREDGTEKRVEGSYGCILSPLEYMMDHDLKVGQVFETPFLLNGVARVFRCEVTGLDSLSDYRSRAYRVDIWAVDRTTGGPDKSPKDVWRKKGNVRVWFAKDGPCRNEMLRMRIKFRWYLWLYFDRLK